MHTHTHTHTYTHRYNLILTNSIIIFKRFWQTYEGSSNSLEFFTKCWKIKMSKTRHFITRYKSYHNWIQTDQNTNHLLLSCLLALLSPTLDTCLTLSSITLTNLVNFSNVSSLKLKCKTIVNASTSQQHFRY